MSEVHQSSHHSLTNFVLLVHFSVSSSSVPNYLFSYFLYFLILCFLFILTPPATFLPLLILLYFMFYWWCQIFLSAPFVLQKLQDPCWTFSFPLQFIFSTCILLKCFSILVFFGLFVIVIVRNFHYIFLFSFLFLNSSSSFNSDLFLFIFFLSTTW